MITDITTYQQLVKQYIAEQAGTTDWSNYLKGLKTPYEAKAVITQQRTAYDISDAYAKYKQSQLNLLRNRNLSESLKNQLSESSRASYQSAYGQYRTQELESLQGIQSDYQTQVAAVEKAANKQASTLDKLTQALYTFGNIDKSKLDVAKGAGGLGYYATEALEEGGTETYLTPYGKAGLGDLVFRGVTTTDDKGESTTQSFSNYLYNTDKDLYEDFMSDPDAFYRTLGFEPGTREFSKEESEMMVAAEDIEQKIKNEYPDLYDEQKTFESSKEKYNYYNNLLNNMSKDRITSNLINFKHTSTAKDSLIGYGTTKKRSERAAQNLNSIFVDESAFTTPKGLSDNIKSKGKHWKIKVDLNKLTDIEKKMLTPYMTIDNGDVIILFKTSAEFENFIEDIANQKSSIYKEK